MTDAPLDGLARYFRYFSTVHAAPLSPLYAAFAAHVAEDERLLRLASSAKKDQPAANLLFGAVHKLLLEGADGGGLETYYPSLGGTTSVDARAAQLFEDFIWAHERAIAEIISTHVTNTNEVGRAAPLLLGFQAIAAEAAMPLHLIEIGPSCGLVLCWDHYRHRIGTEEIGPADSPVVLTPEIRGPQPPLAPELPRVASRVGLEMYPVDLNDPQTLAWQRALIWPEHTDRAERFARAFAIARDVAPQIIAGDATQTLPQVLDALPEDGAVCLHHSFVFYQIPHEKKLALSAYLKDQSRKRPIWRLGFEWAGAEALQKDEGENCIGISRYRHGDVSYQRLAFCDPHGRWINWAPASPQPGDFL